MNIQILPSLLAADFGNLEAAARLAENSGADALHLDIMDGHFVPNLSMGPDVVAMAKRCVDIPLNVHLMMTNPDQYLSSFIEAGADSLHIHIEAACDVPEAIDRIRELGARPGITLNPETPAEMIWPVLEKVDEVMCMTVHPGYSGQSFIESVVPKMRKIRDKANSIGRTDLDLLVDGGVTLETAVKSAEAGANSFIAGATLYRAADMAAEIARIREKATESLVL